ncbi:diacylglycerol kinase family protein [Bacteroides timonensis]|uniref:diacylglycerol kinase family protein n=1 Tax=Bacteroides timonensis TaxID=1470345 RepID=UPI0005C71E49|nr:diacylglycerol kinase family protein [Bacteroides timonensis]
MKYSFKKQIHSFGYAWKGIQQCVGKEQNLSFHLITTAVVIAIGFFFGITRTEWIVIILCIGVVIAAELFNTAIEKLVDLVSPERHPIAGQVKDIAAGAVLVCAVAAAIIGIIIFLPYL